MLETKDITFEIFSFRCVFLNPGVFEIAFVVVEKFWVNVKLDSEVTGRDSLYVPLNIVVLLDFLDVVEIVNDK